MVSFHGIEAIQSYQKSEKSHCDSVDLSVILSDEEFSRWHFVFVLGAL